MFSFFYLLFCPCVLCGRMSFTIVRWLFSRKMIIGRLLSASMDGKRVWVESGEGMGGGVMTFTCTTSGHRRLDIDIASAVGLDITVASFGSSRG